DVPGRAARLAFARRGPDARWSALDRQVLRDLGWALRHLLSFAAQASALRGLEEQLQFALRSLPMILWVTDARGRLVVAEGSGLTQLGLRREQVLGRSMEDVLGGTLNLSELRADLAAGQERRQEVTLAGRVYDTQRVRLPRGSGTLGVAFDVTDLVESRAQARRAQRHAETLLDLTQVMALTGSLPDVTRQALEVLLPALPHSWLVLWFRDGPLLRPLVSCGEQPAAVAQWQRQGVPLTDLFAQRLLAAEAVQLDPVDLPSRLRAEGLHGALLLPVRAGETLMVLGAYRREPLAWTPVERDLLSVAAQVVQVSLERRDTLAGLRSAAVTDPLTGLGNRRAFESDLREALARGPLTLVALDVDGLKAVNDTLGHARGDDLLRGVARVLAGVVTSGDGAYRVGGDEFCLLLRGAPGQIPDLDAAFAALAGEGFGPAGASAGWASAPQDGQDPEVLWQLADERMYREKARRRPGR
ncbi:diguanylate cyclase domain-containing protein, partial [Deinococcus xianganensis]